MAAAYGPEPAHGASTMDMSSHFTDRRDGADDDSSIPRTHDAQLPAPPNPPFVFPARMDLPASSLPAQPRTTGRRPMSAFEPQRQALGPAAGNADRPRRGGSVALPAFSFNPGASLPPTPGSLLSPPASPYSPKNDLPSPARPPMGHGHRRGGSEFVGGRLREGNSIAVMSTSPTRSENGLSSPSLVPPKRGHRRGMSSANISISDMPNLNPPFDFASLKGSSAPTSPTNFDRTMEMPTFMPEPLDLTKSFAPTADRPNTNTNSETPSPTEGDVPPTRPARARVGFSDTLEFIPRPLSMVSSDTSSVATARPGHSVSGSISSVVSAASPSGRESPAPLSRSPTKELAEPRPSTAGAILEGTADAANPGRPTASPRRRNSIPALLDLPDASAVAPPTPSPSKTPKRWSFFGLDAFAASSPVKARPSSSSSSGSIPRATSAGSSSEHGSESAVDLADDVKAKSKSSKKSKKKKGKKGWTGSILPRKSKSKNAPEVPERPLTPPTSTLTPEDNEALMDSPETVSPMTTPTVTVTESTTPPRKKDGLKRRGEDSTVSMIDLDAALGPFNTPLPHNPEWEAAQRAAGNVGKRRLHSAQGLKGFSGPGMHYHRRSESAPDLPPFDAGRSALSRFGSSSTMADVFEEDEEDDESGASEKNGTVVDRLDSDEQSDGDLTPPAVPQREFLAEKQEAPHTIKHQSSGLSDKDQSSARSIRMERSRTSLQDNVIAEEPFSFPPRAPNMFHGSIDSTDSGMLPLRQESSSVDASGVQHGNIPISPYSMSHASSFPSPRSPVSIDAQRISTAPSSIADETNFQSLLMGEPGPEVRLSVDYDIPSLTSSNSTMTRDSGFAPNLRMPRPALREQRPVSVSSAFGRRRSSLASLSRLISSSHGERSKLSMEVTLDDEATKNKSKTSRSKRLSKLMQFWKSGKEGSSS